MVDGDETDGVFAGPVGDLGVAVAGGRAGRSGAVAVGQPLGAVDRGVDVAAGLGEESLADDDLATVEGVPRVLASLHEQGGNRITGVGAIHVVVGGDVGVDRGDAGDQVGDSEASE